MNLLKTAKTIISQFLNGIAKIFFRAGSIEKPQICDFCQNLMLYLYKRRDRDYRSPKKAANKKTRHLPGF